MGLFHRSKAGVETPLEIDGIGDDPPETPAAATGGGLGPKADPAPQPQAAAPAPKQDAPAQADPELAKLRAELAERDRQFEAVQKQVKDLETARTLERVAAVKAEAKTFAAGLGQKKLLIGSGPQGMADLRSYAFLAASGLPTEGIDPVASINALVSGLVPHNLTGEAVSDAAAHSAGVFRVDNGSAGAAETDEEIKASNDRFFARQGHKPFAAATP